MNSSTHELTHSTLTLWITYTHNQFTVARNLLIHSLAYSVIHSHSLTQFHSLIHSLTQSLLTHSPTLSITHHHSLTQLLIHSQSHSLNFSQFHSLTHSLTLFTLCIFSVGIIKRGFHGHPRTTMMKICEQMKKRKIDRIGSRLRVVRAQRMSQLKVGVNPAHLSQALTHYQS